jgi:hypothetical protein
MANPWAGEAELVIDGERRRLKLTLGALAELEAGLGADTLVALVERFEAGGFSSRDVLALIVAGLRGGTGLMGEAGPEAIMPLARGADGKLGVRGNGGGSVNVVMNISTPDADGFRRSQGQIAAQMSRVIARGQRNR